MLAVELIGPSEDLESFCRAHGELLTGRVIVHKTVEHWQLEVGRVVVHDELDGEPAG